MRNAERTFVCRGCHNETPATDMRGGRCTSCRLDRIDPRYLPGSGRA